VTRRGVGHGLALWFDADLAPGVAFSNAPGQPPLIYGQAFFPWPEPVALSKGDLVDVRLGADLVGEDYVWTWDVRFRRPAEPGAPAMHFRQSTFFGSPVTAEDRARGAPAHRPALGETGEIAHFVLASMDGAISIGEIGERLLGRRRSQQRPAESRRQTHPDDRARFFHRFSSLETQATSSAWASISFSRMGIPNGQRLEQEPEQLAHRSARLDEGSEA